MTDIIKININDEVTDTAKIIKSCFKGKEKWICTVNKHDDITGLKKTINKREIQTFNFKGEFPIRNQSGNMYNTIYRREQNIIMSNKTLCSFQQRFLNVIRDGEYALVMNLPSEPYFEYSYNDEDWKIFSVMYEGDGLKVLDNGIMEFDEVKFSGYGDYFTFMHDMICRKQIVYKEKIFYGFLCPEIFSAFKRIYLLISKDSATDYEYWNLPIEEKIARNSMDSLENGKLFVLEKGL